MKKLFLFAFLSILSSQTNSFFIDGVAAIVEDKIVLKSDLNQMVNMMAIQQNINPNENINRFIKLRSVVLESMIDQKILLEMAEEDTTIEFSEKEVNQALDQQINNILMQAGGEKEAEKMLGQSIKSFRSEFWYEMKDKIISEKYQQKLLSKIKISKKDVLSFFNTYVDSLPMFPTEAKIRHLLIKPTPSDSVKKETIFMLNNIKNKINNGESFSFFAEKYSMDPGSKNKGGNLGWVKRGSLLKEFEEVTFTIKEKTISNPIETDVGFHILEVFERKGDRARVRHILISPQIQKSDEEIAFNFANILKDSCENIQKFKFREDDILIMSHPKTGSTWAQETVWLMVNNLDIVKSKNIHKRFRTPALKKIYDEKFGEQFFENLEGRRVIKCHIPFDFLPHNVLERCKVIYMARNPKDTAVSFYHHLKRKGHFKGDFCNFAQMFKDELLHYSYWNHLLSAWQLRGHPNLKIMWYEDMKEDTAAVVTGL